MECSSESNLGSLPADCSTAIDFFPGLLSKVLFGPIAVAPEGVVDLATSIGSWNDSERGSSCLDSSTANSAAELLLVRPSSSRTSPSAFGNDFSSLVGVMFLSFSMSELSLFDSLVFWADPSCSIHSDLG